MPQSAARPLGFGRAWGASVLEMIVGIGAVVVVVAVMVVFAWRVLRMRVTVVKGRKRKPKEFLTDKDIDELLTIDGKEDEE